ncbi:MAG: ABC transporter ATP-binding protein [Rickettsiales bacterium]|nr:ABC transporter ATP-binding protein [Rickettsiales bacterium]
MTKQDNYALNIANLTKSYGDKTIIDSIDLNVEKGEILGLVGVNGIGKTTLIKIILDLLSFDNGDVKIFGKSNKDNNSRQNLSYLPEKFAPSQYLYGKEFLDISSQQFGKKFDIEKAKSIATKLDLAHDAFDLKIGKYSKGMGQKLGLISVFLSDANLLILDEPMSGLDPHVRIRLKELIKEYKQENKTVFFSSHILSDIDEISNRIAVIHNKKIIFTGKPKDFKQKYKASTLEKAFLLAINKL